MRERPWLRRQHHLTRVTGELLTALLCFILAPIVIALAGAKVTIPIWFGLLAIVVTALVTRAVFVTSKSNRLLLEAVMRNARVVQRFEQESRAERGYLREAIGDLSDAQAEIDDDVDLTPDDGGDDGEGPGSAG
jgi:hypothetical protein